MRGAVSNTSPVLYLYRAGVLELLPKLFDDVWIPGAVEFEIQNGRRTGCDVPDLNDFDWLEVVEPNSVPSEWLALDLGPGEIAAMSLALENPDRIVLLDDSLARRIALAAGLNVWGTLRVLLEAKTQNLVEEIAPIIKRLEERGMWISDEIRKRVLNLAGET